MTDATDRARELGAEHGRTAAEAWIAQGDERAIRRGVLAGYRTYWPRPSLSLGGLYRVCRGGSTQVWNAHLYRLVRETYEAAFTAAVEATIREKCEGVKP